jgi:chromosome segregation ATPase
MLSNLIKDLESKISRAINKIDGLNNEKSKLERENESLRRQVEELQARIGGLEEALANRPEVTPISGSGPDIDVIKLRLEKLAGKLATLEESWN